MTGSEGPSKVGGSIFRGGRGWSFGTSGLRLTKLSCPAGVR